MQISNGIKIKDLCLIIGRTLLIPDTHMGYEEAMNKQGYMLPRTQFQKTIQRLEKVFHGIDVDTVVLMGDVKHEFGFISETEWRHTLELLDFIGEHCEKIVLLKGNHDKVLGPIAKKRKIEIEDYYVIGDIYLCHGHEIPKDIDFSLAKRIIIAHEHPAIGLRKGARLEKYKCFLKGKFGKKELIVMPSFNLVTEGMDIIREEHLSPFLDDGLEDFEVIVIDQYGEPLHFGKLAQLKDIEF